MKKLFALGSVLLTSVFMAGSLYAYNYSHDPSFARMMARAATIDAPDAVYYNAVGLVKMDDGMYIEIGNQMGAKRYMHKFIAANYHDATPSYIMPNLALVWKKDKAAIFLEMHIPAGGGTLMYRNIFGIGTLLTEVAGLGLPLLPSKLKASSFWIQGSMGGSFAFTEWLAVTGCVKYSMYSYEMAVGYVGLGTISKEKTSAGAFSGAGGIMITPMKELSITALYSTEVIARGTTRDLKTHYSHIDEARLPDYLLIGINIKPTETLSIQASYQLNFSNQKNYGASTPTASLVRDFAYAGVGLTTSTLITGGNTQDYKGRMNHKVGLGGELKVHKMLMLSLGLSYETQDCYPRAQIPFDPELKNIGVGLGMKIMPTDNFSIQIGGAKYTYFTDHMMLGLVKMNKSVWQGAISLTAKVM
ncbi:MAG: hypothetical protein JXA07_05260 [Spirochaetes bacterium]|nr:hypothetical protein [Spirochaetota bacterium]